MEEYCPFIAPPKRDFLAFSYIWSGIQIKMTTNKGLSVFATKAIEPGLILPYGGVEIFAKEYTSLQKKAGTDKCKYIVGGSMDSDKDSSGVKS